METVCTLVIVFLGIPLSCTAESEHRTKAASEKLLDLYCYKCDTIVHEERCLDLKENSSAIYAKCALDQRICKVQTITMSTSTEDTPGFPKLWLLQRNCTKVCEPVCVTIGERTKLRSCTKCCETSFCNTGNGAGVVRTEYDARMFAITLTLLLWRLISDKDTLLDYNS